MRFYFAINSPYVLIAILILFMIIWLMYYKYKKNIYFIICFMFFYTYICLLIKYTQFPITIDFVLANKEMVLSNINWIPFRHFGSNFSNAILNIILTMPFGFLFPLIKCNLKKKILWFWVFFLPFLLEGLQLFLGIVTGYSERIIDINDCICNAFGILIGYGIYKVFVALLQRFIDKEDIQKSGWLKYITQNRL